MAVGVKLDIGIHHRANCKQENKPEKRFNDKIQRNVWHCPDCGREATAVVDENTKREFKN